MKPGYWIIFWLSWVLTMVVLLAGCTPCEDRCVSYVRVDAGGATYMGRQIVYGWGQSRWEIYDKQGTMVSHFGPDHFERLVQRGMTYETMGEVEWLQVFDRTPMVIQIESTVNLYPATQPEGD